MPHRAAKSMLEKHVQTILLAIITAAIIWGSNQVFLLSIGMAEVKVQLQQLNEKSEKYVTMDYVIEKSKTRDQQISDHDRRISKLEALMDAMNVRATARTR